MGSWQLLAVPLAAATGWIAVSMHGNKQVSWDATGTG